MMSNHTILFHARRGKAEAMNTPEAAQRRCFQRNLTLHAFLPDAACILACEQMQEPDGHAYLCCRVALNQHLGMQARPISILFCPGFRVEPPESPALLILDRSAPVGVQQVALIQHGIGDLAHSFPIHRATPSPTPDSRRSTACSNVGMLSRDLKSRSRSNTSRRSVTQAVFG